MRRDPKLLRTFVVLSFAASAILMTGNAVVACNDNPLVTTPDCTPGVSATCTCDQDPTQETCIGFNARPEGGIDPADANHVETSVPTDSAVPDDGGGDLDGDTDAGDDAADN